MYVRVVDVARRSGIVRYGKPGRVLSFIFRYMYKTIGCCCAHRVKNYSCNAGRIADSASNVHKPSLPSLTQYRVCSTFGCCCWEPKRCSSLFSPLKNVSFVGDADLPASFNSLCLFLPVWGEMSLHFFRELCLVAPPPFDECPCPNQNGKRRRCCLLLENGMRKMRALAREFLRLRERRWYRGGIDWTSSW